MQENQSSNASGSGGGAGAIVPAAAAKAGCAAASVGKGPRSCLDALWELLQQRERLQKEQPEVLAKLLQVRCLQASAALPRPAPRAPLPACILPSTSSLLENTHDACLHALLPIHLAGCRCCLPSGSPAAPPSERWLCCSGSQACGGTSLACSRQPARRVR